MIINSTFDLRWSNKYSITPGFDAATLCKSSSGTQRTNLANTFPNRIM